MNELVKNSTALIDRAHTSFNDRNALKMVSFADERAYAIQAFMSNDYLSKTALSDPASTVAAMSNVASVGLSLNPVTQFAYLIPRDGRVMLDISYKGLIKIATDSGSIKWARAELVYSNDDFKYNGPAAMPIHSADVFNKDRGDFVGVYVIAKTSDGDILTEAMNADEVYKVRDKSMLYDKKKAGPWVDWFGEMAKKTAIKRASKTWPKTDKQGGSERLAKAIDVVNQHEGLTELASPASPAVTEKMKEAINSESALEIRELYEESGGMKSLAFNKLAPVYKGKAKDLLLDTAAANIKEYFAAISDGDKDSAIDMAAGFSDFELLEAGFLVKTKDSHLHAETLALSIDQFEAQQ